MRYPVNYIAITQGLHYGKCIDFGWSNAYGGKNQPVFACDDGVVYRIENQKNGGNVIYIEHLNGMVSCYAHLADDSIIVKVGDVITKGRQIALMGTTGAASTGNHLHFALYSNKNVIYKESTVNPFEYLEVYPTQIVNSTTEEKYKLKKYLDNQDIRYVSGVDYEGLNVRKSPSLSAPVVGMLYTADKVNIYDEFGNFVRIGLDQWVYKSYLGKVIPNYRTVSSKELNIRSGPGTNYNLIGMIYDGDKVEIYGTKGSWVKISPFIEAWVSANYLE